MNHENIGKVLYHDGGDVSDLKIYHDYSINQFKVRHRCNECALDLGCFCYETIDDAIYACEEVSWTCAKHLLLDIWEESELVGEIDRVCGTNLLEITSDAHDRSDDEIKAILDSITEDQARSILYDLDISDMYDYTWAGEACAL